MSEEFHKLDNQSQVFFYEQDFYVLSNFSAFKLPWDGYLFDTSEAVYHYEKFKSTAPHIAHDIRVAFSAHEAFKLAEVNKHRRRKDWDAVKVAIMRDILRAKVQQHEYVRRKLLATGHRELIEDSWRDEFWGWGLNRDGQNMLGKLWMEIRAELRATIKPKEYWDLKGIELPPDTFAVRSGGDGYTLLVVTGRDAANEAFALLHGPAGDDLYEAYLKDIRDNDNWSMQDGEVMSFKTDYECGWSEVSRLTFPESKK